MNRTFLARLMLLATVALTAGVAACSEKLEAGAACPQLCPQDQIPLQDTILDAVAVDTSIAGFPAIGNETYLVLASRGDTLDTRVIFRYDTIPSTYLFPSASADSTIRVVDSAAITLRVDTIHGRPAGPVTISAYDLGDSTVADTVASALLPLFTPDRLLGSRTFARDSLVDSIRVPLSNVEVLSKLQHGRPLRVGFRLTSSTSAAVRFFSAGVATSGTLRFRVSRDTAVAAISVTPNSRTPTATSLAFLRGALADYVIVAKGPPPPPPTEIAVGGLPGERLYVRFNIPPRILDSARIVRASLQLFQVPNPASPAAGDTLSLYPMPILAGPAVTDIAQALRLASPPGTFALDSVIVAPLGSGLKEIQIVPLVQRWALTPSDSSPHALAIRTSTEGIKGSQVLFYSTRAPAGLRPRLRLTYVPHLTFSLP